MKFKFILLILIIWQTGQSQIMVGYKGFTKWKKENFKRFKKTKTIFILPDVYSKSTYDSILKASWHVTPYEIVRKKDFDINDYAGNQYSYARITGTKTIIYSEPKRFKNRIPIGYKFDAYLNIYMHDFDKLKEGLNALSSKQKKKDEKIQDVFDKNTTKFALVLLFQDTYLLHFVRYNDIDEIEKRIYRSAEFYNYKPGFLKNYLQKINNLIQKEQYYWSFRRKYLPELKNLKNHTLFVPDFVARKYNSDSKQFEKPSETFLNEIFKDYEYKYQLIDTDELNKKILNNEPIYYFLFFQLDGVHYYEIVNAQTGEFIYDNTKRSFKANAKAKNIKEINKYINKAAKKY